MRPVRFAVALFYMLASSATLANAQALHGGPVELAQLKNSRSSTRKELGQARKQLRYSGCRRMFSRNRSGGACRAMRARVKELEGELSRGRAVPSKRRARAVPDSKGKRRRLGRTARAGYRTLCVRVCDGYYFSLSHMSPRKRFTKDAEKCARMYGPDEAVLFYHRFPYGDASQAVSLDGLRYADQEYAFAFRETFVPRCAAQLQYGLAALRSRVFAVVPGLLGEEVADADAGTAADDTPFPIAWRSPWGDPETRANRSGGFVPKPTRPTAAIAETAIVRTVGDPYLFAEATAGPPPTVVGYEPPVLTDFRVPQGASMLPTLDVNVAAELKPSLE